MRDDWVSPWWQALLLPDEWDVAGVRVPSLSVWHVFALSNVGNAYVCGGSVSPDDALGMLIVASLDYRDGRRLFLRGRFHARIRRRLYRKISKQDQEFVAAACKEYASSCLRHGHRLSTPGAGGAPAGTPEPWAVYVALRRLGDAEAVAWDTPYAKGRATMDALDERTGGTTMAPWNYGEDMFDHWDEYSAMTGTKDLVMN